MWLGIQTRKQYLNLQADFRRAEGPRGRWGRRFLVFCLFVCLFWGRHFPADFFFPWKFPLPETNNIFALENGWLVQMIQCLLGFCLFSGVNCLLNFRNCAVGLSGQVGGGEGESDF